MSQGILGDLRVTALCIAAHLMLSDRNGRMCHLFWREEVRTCLFELCEHTRAAKQENIVFLSYDATIFWSFILVRIYTYLNIH